MSDPSGFVRQRIARNKSGHVRLSRIAEQLLVEANRSSQRWVPKDIYEFQERAGLRPATWFAPYVDVLHRAVDERLYVAFSSGPQQGKTETSAAGIGYHCVVNPGEYHAYITYNRELANEFRDRALAMWRKVGMVCRVKDGNKIVVDGGAENGGSTVLFTSINGAITGKPIRGIIIIDDPIKSPVEVRSTSFMANLHEWFSKTVMLRGSMGKGSVVIMATRWAERDLTGLAIERDGFDYIRIPSLCEDPAYDPIGRTRVDQAAVPELQSEEDLRAIRDRNPRLFAQMYQGVPISDGARVFNFPALYTTLDPHANFVHSGTDLSYAGKRGGDFSVAVRMRTNRQTRLTYVDLLTRKQCHAPDFVPELRRVTAGGGMVKWIHGHGPEMGVGHFIKEKVPQLVLEPNRNRGKFAIAYDSGFVDAVNEGRVLFPAVLDSDGVPRIRPDMVEFVDELLSFTGDDDAHDDTVDAAANAFSLVNVDSSPLKVNHNRASAARSRAQARRDRVW